jgi:hypothetical protein
MRRFKIGFLAIIGILAMSFTIANNPKVHKKMRVDINQCYQPAFTNFKYLVCPSGTFTSITDCTTGNASEGQYLDPSLGLGSLYNDSEDPLACNGESVICCVKFEEVSTAPSCGTVLRGTVNTSTGQVTINSNPQSGTPYIKVLQVECKN